MQKHVMWLRTTPSSMRCHVLPQTGTTSRAFVKDQKTGEPLTLFWTLNAQGYIKKNDLPFLSTLFRYLARGDPKLASCCSCC